ncbi:hypothetical protein PC116_g16155 [Phytophthora cactorum]|uniref:RxLR effector protein n=1 Tax=Phytophthora cactorum TaxID=29920 RepID=A0A8T0YJQ0_9STRA|nr:hypothetical protein PC113_g15529 [Phytophthora cactorum]KAG2891224.1 hypothetical protein PC114_g17084 [Phytophthora cactorum]KAG2904071.1 hypothetical protein PC115_g15109 [Phytophthora cactorum]KAG2920484.1 hypothetical protein PC117_g16477 [Phytophthora cactorum]KAG4042446.1 hypothetical protein PC123_g22062 [Phytophthora cactorum]
MQLIKALVIAAVATTLCLAPATATDTVEVNKNAPPNSRKLYYTKTPPATRSPPLLLREECVWADAGARETAQKGKAWRRAALVPKRPMTTIDSHVRE